MIGYAMIVAYIPFVVWILMEYRDQQKQLSKTH